MRTASCLLPILLGIFVAPLTGCGEVNSETQATADDHGHDHDHEHTGRPKSLHAAVAELTEIRNAVREAIVDGDPDDAHDPLHEVGELLGVIPDIAAETDLPKEEWEAVNAANDTLFDAFGTIDKAFHTKDGNKQAAYESVSTELDEAIQTIRSRLALTGEQPESGEAPHHDHDDHEGHHHNDYDDIDAESDAPAAGATS